MKIQLLKNSKLQRRYVKFQDCGSKILKHKGVSVNAIFVTVYSITVLYQTPDTLKPVFNSFFYRRDFKSSGKDDGVIMEFWGGNLHF